MDFTASELLLFAFLSAVLCSISYTFGIGRTKQSLQRASMAKKTERSVSEIHSVLRELQASLEQHKSYISSFNDKRKDDSTNTLEDLESLIRSCRELTSEIGFGQSRILAHVDELSAVSESRTDALTGIGNRRMFEEQIAKLMQRQSRGDAMPFVVTLIDVDHFKKINDQYGHQAGDKVLQKIAAVIQNEVRQNDVVARIGGEEFAVIFAGCEIETADGILSRIITKIESTSVEFGEKRISVTASGGIAKYEADDESGLSLMARADEALYQAKNKGRNCICIA